MNALPTGEWQLREEIRPVQGEDFYCAEITVVDRLPVVMLQSSQHCPPRGLSHDETRAMARLMVAAPKMLRALKMILERCPIGGAVEEIAEAAITEAEGRS